MFLDHIAGDLEEMFEDETLAVMKTLLAVSAVQTVNCVPRCLSDTVRAVFDEGLLPMMIRIVMRVVQNGSLILLVIEVVLKAAQDKELVLLVVEGALRAFLNAGLTRHFGFLIASLTDFVKSYDDLVHPRTGGMIEIALGLGQTKTIVLAADSGDEIASEYLPGFRCTLGRCANL